MRLNSFWNKIKDKWYAYKYHHHIVDTGLPPSGFYDVDVRMLYAVMSIVQWYVDNDMGDVWSEEDLKQEIERINNTYDDPELIETLVEQVKFQKEADDITLSIAKWWKNYPKRQKEISEALREYNDFVTTHNPEWTIDDADDIAAEIQMRQKRLKKMEDQLEKEEEEYMILAVKWRGTMWS